MNQPNIERSDNDCVPELVIVVGASAGGLKEVATLVQLLPPWFRGTMIVAKHRSPDSGNVLATILANHARVRVDEPVDEESLECTTIYVGASDEKVEVEGDEFVISTATSRYARLHRIDDLFKSVARSFGPNAIGVILSGMLSDGVEGLEAIQKAGGYCIVQCPREAEFDSMPKNALERIEPDFVGTTQEIASVLMELSAERAAKLGWQRDK